MDMEDRLEEGEVEPEVEQGSSSTTRTPGGKNLDVPWASVGQPAEENLVC